MVGVNFTYNIAIDKLKIAKLKKVYLSKQAFTLLELLLVIAIVAALAGLIINALNPAQRLEEANEAKYLSTANDIEKALEIYAVENGGNLPTVFSSLGYGYYEICNGGQSTNCINIDDLVPAYLPSVPKDTTDSTEIVSGFKLKYDPSKKEVGVYSNNEYSEMLTSGYRLGDGLMGYWKLDETTEPSIDYSGRGYDATWSGDATTALGRFGNGIKQEAGANGYLDVSDAGDPFDMGSGNFSISMWFNLDSVTTPAAPELLDKMQSNILGYHLRVGYAQEIEFQIRGTTTNLEFNTTSGLIGTGQWYHVVAVYDKVNGHKIYVNGVQSGSTGSGDAGNVDNTDPLRIGTGFNGFEMDGTYDEVRIYQRGLSSGEISYLYENGAPPVAHWKFDEGAGNVAADSSYTGNTGTLTNGPTWVGGKTGYGINLDGIDDFVSITSVGLNKETGTILMWFKPQFSSTTLTGRPIFFKWGTGCSSTNSTNTFDLQFRTNPGLYFKAGDTTLGEDLASSGVTFVEDSWNHVGATWNRNTGTGSNGTIQIYWNGNLHASKSTTFTAINPTGNPVIGTGGCGSPLLAVIDEVRIYNYVRTQAQILEDMNNN